MKDSRIIVLLQSKRGCTLKAFKHASKCKYKEAAISYAQYSKTFTMATGQKGWLLVVTLFMHTSRSNTLINIIMNVDVQQQNTSCYFQN